MLKSLRSRASALLTLLALPFLFVFALLQPDGGGGEGGTGGEGEGGNGGGEGGGQGQGGEGGGQGGTGAAGAEFTPITSQEDFDRRLGERLGRERAKYADYDAVKAKADRLDELEAANQTELERVQAEAARNAEERDAALAKAAEQAKRSAVIAAATVAKAADPNDVFALLTTEQKNALTIGDDGQVTGAEGAVEALLKAKPHLVGKQGTSGSADGGTRDTGGEKPKTLEGAVSSRMNAT